MNQMAARASPSTSHAIADRLNKGCFCVTLDRAALCKALIREAGDPEFCVNAIETRPHLFSNVPVFLPSEVIGEMAGIVAAIEQVARMPAYREAAFAWAPEIAREDRGPLGAFMGYDFHLGGEGPRLIEINTNAGGAFLNALLARAQLACCGEVAAGLEMLEADDFAANVVAMFKEEWRRRRGDRTMPRVAIVDDRPQEQ